MADFLVGDGGRLIFDADGHRYTSDGVLVPSVSQVLRAQGLIDTSHYTEEHSARGTRVHALINSRLRGLPDASRLAAPESGYLVAWSLFQRAHTPQPILTEFPLHDPGRVAGLVDFYGHINQQPLAVVLDFKTGPYQWWHEAQTAGYEHLLRRLELPVHRRATVHLSAEGTFTLRFHISGAARQDWEAAFYLTERRLAHHGRDERFAICGGTAARGSGPPPDEPPARDGAGD